MDSLIESCCLPKNNDKHCFKLIVITALHHKETGISQWIMRINTSRRDLSLQYKKLSKRASLTSLSTCYFNIVNSIYGAGRSELNGECGEPTILLIIVDGENRHYTPLSPNLSMLFLKLNGKFSRAYLSCINCLNGFWTALASFIRTTI